MIANMGTIDRILRAAQGVALLYLSFFSSVTIFADPLFKYGAAVVGLVMLATSAIRLCPLYSLFGIKTCKEC